MTDEKEEQDTRSKFYNSQTVVRYIKAVGIPKTGMSRMPLLAAVVVKLSLFSSCVLIFWSLFRKRYD
jgi:hypothetical protein